MIKLRTSNASPYGRKVMITILENKLEKNLEILPPVTENPDKGICPENPLGKVPTLILGNGKILYDSAVICEYLDQTALQKLFPKPGPNRWFALRMQALADGIMDAAVLCRMEEYMRPPNFYWEGWVNMQKNKIHQSLEFLEKEIDSFLHPPTIGEFSLGAALGYLNFRFAHDTWYENRPNLKKWFVNFSELPSMKTTEPQD
ncbi:MAG: glutathione S-transferase family protein [Alphaproteobacteria bacterium]|nr:glutathione S-transferase family protein [Alphaproteobacteria bacterium]